MSTDGGPLEQPFSKGCAQAEQNSQRLQNPGHLHLASRRLGGSYTCAGQRYTGARFSGQKLQEDVSK